MFCGVTEIFFFFFDWCQHIISFQSDCGCAGSPALHPAPGVQTLALPHALCSSSYLPLLPAALWAAPSPFSAVLAGRSASTGAALGELPGVTGRAALAQAFGSDLERLPECQGLCTPYFHALLSSSDPPSEPSSPVPPCRTLAVPSNAWCLATRAGSAPGHVGPSKVRRQGAREPGLLRSGNGRPEVPPRKE